MTHALAQLDPQDVGFTTSIDLVSRLVRLEGQAVVDVGCGDLTFSRQLAAHGARALGVDPDPAQAERNRAADATPGLTFRRADATALPVDDGSQDGVFFSFSLHHVPAVLYPRVFDEVRRVLKPDGYLCVIEPVHGPLNEIMRLFHDEDQVRAEALRALAQLAVPTFESLACFRYHTYLSFASFDDYATQHGAKSFNPDYTEADVRRPEVEATFERLGAPDYRFESPKLLALLRGVRPA
jgi:ubiquinone/menaquinone biosynthesis C-methylase UbiE